MESKATTDDNTLFILHGYVSNVEAHQRKPEQPCEAHDFEEGTAQDKAEVGGVG